VKVTSDFDGELLGVQRERSHQRMQVGLAPQSRSAHVMAAPPATERRRLDTELADQRGQRRIVGTAARLHPQDGHTFPRHRLPLVTEQRLVGGIEEGQQHEVAPVGGQRREVREQRRGRRVPRQHVLATSQHQRGDVVQRVQQLLDLRGHALFSRLPPDAGRRHLGDREQVGPFVRRQFQSIGQGGQHRPRNPAGTSLFQAHHVVDADVRPLGQFLPPQPGHPAQPPVVDQPEPRGIHGGPLGAQEVTQDVVPGRGSAARGIGG